MQTEDIALFLDANKGNYNHPDFYQLKLSLIRWATEAHMGGGFVRALLENDLQRAVSTADQHNLVWIPTAAVFMYNRMPLTSWGSRELVNAWPQDLETLLTTDRTWADRFKERNGV